VAEAGCLHHHDALPEQLPAAGEHRPGCEGERAHPPAKAPEGVPQRESERRALDPAALDEPLQLVPRPGIARLAPTLLTEREQRDVRPVIQFLRQQVRQPPDAQVSFAVSGHDRGYAGRHEPLAAVDELVPGGRQRVDAASLEHLPIRHPHDGDQVPRGPVGLPPEAALGPTTDLGHPSPWEELLERRQQTVPGVLDVIDAVPEEVQIRRRPRQRRLRQGREHPVVPEQARLHARPRVQLMLQRRPRDPTGQARGLVLAPPPEAHELPVGPHVRAQGTHRRPPRPCP
jgi:hypothetical protein